MSRARLSPIRLRISPINLLSDRSWKKSFSYFRASTYKSSGRRFPKDITSDPVFRAIAYSQKWRHDLKRITEASVSGVVKKMGAKPTEELKSTVERTLGTLREHHQ